MRKSPTTLSIIIMIALASCQIEKPINNIALNPKAATYNTQLGLAYLKQGNRQRAKQKLLLAVAEDPHSAYTNQALAYYFEQTHDLKQAEQYYQNALQIAPQSGAILNNYGDFLCHQGKYNEANQYFLKAVSDPQYVNTALAYENAGICALSAKNFNEAKKYFQQALAQDPSLRQAKKELQKL